MTRLNYIQSALTDSLKEEFKIRLTLQAIQQEIEESTKESVLYKYKDSVLKRDDMEFEFVGVKTSFDVHHYSEKPVSIRLMYICKSKLPKDKREKVEKIKKDYLEGNHIYSSNLKIPLWHQLHYWVTLEKAYSGDIKLNLE